MGNLRFDEVAAANLAEKAILIAITLIATYLLAKAAKWAFAKVVDNIAFFRRHNTASGESMGHALGRLAALLIWLVGLIIVLQILDLAEALAPLQSLLSNVFAFIPNLIGAGVLFFIGLVIAKIVRDLVTTALETVDVDRYLNRGRTYAASRSTVAGTTTTATAPGAATGATGTIGGTEGMHLGRTVGTILYALIVIFFAIMALDILNIRAVSEPASEMLNLILNSLPLMIGAALLIGIGYLVGRFVAQLLEEILPGLGVDQAIGSTDLLPGSVTVSSIVAKVAQIAIVLFFAIAATRLLGFPELTRILNQVLQLGGQVIFGAAVILIGFLIARMLARMIGGSEETGLAALIVKWATIFVFTFMGLQFTGIGEDIIRIFFGALVIGAAVAGALAFGIGGREWAGRKLEQLDAKAREHAAKPASASDPVAGATTRAPRRTTTTTQTSSLGTGTGTGTGTGIGSGGSDTPPTA